MRLRAHGVMALALAALVPGCVSTARSPADETGDHITASDQSDVSKRSRVRLELAGAYFGRGQMEFALDQVKLAIQIDPTQSEAFNLRGLIYANLGDDRLAEESFRRALQLNPLDADAMQNLGWYLCQRKRFDEAHVLFEQALAVPRYRDSARTYLTQGICHSQAGQLELAERSLLRSSQLEPRNMGTAFTLADVLYRRQEYERARFYVRRVNASKDVATAQSLWLAVRIENRLGQLRARQDLGQQLVRRFPNSREASAFERGSFDE